MNIFRIVKDEPKFNFEKEIVISFTEPELNLLRELVRNTLHIYDPIMYEFQKEFCSVVKEVLK